MKKIIAILIPFILPIAVFAQQDPYFNIYQAPNDPGYSTGELSPDSGSTDVTSQLNSSSNVNPYDPDVTPTTSTPGSSTFLDTSSFKNFVASVARIISGTLIPLLITAGIVMFTWSLAMFVLKSNDQKEREKAKQYMIWSIIGLALVFSIWGISAILRNTFFAGTTDSILPQFPESEI